MIFTIDDFLFLLLAVRLHLLQTRRRQPSHNFQCLGFFIDSGKQEKGMFLDSYRLGCSPLN